MIRVLIVCDIRLYREGLARILERSARLRVAGTQPSVAEAIAAHIDPAPDVVLLDMASAEALQGIGAISEACGGVPVVALGVPRRDSDVVACAEAGVAGYVFRDASVDEFVETVEGAASGRLLCSPEIAATLLRRLSKLAANREPDRDEPSLTRREREIVRLIDDGLSNKEIAARLCIELTTVKNHVHHLLEKLGARNRSEAAAKVRRLATGSPLPTRSGSLELPVRESSDPVPRRERWVARARATDRYGDPDA